ncbi:MAG: serine/threonine-protein kinase [Polyangiales bacterium]
MSSAPASPSPNPVSGVIKPQWLGRYEVLDEIAQGGMATVYLGRARGAANFERLVAVKVCLPHLRGDEEFSGMFLDEARLAARIHHPNVVATLDVGDEEALYLVMEYIEGDKLSTLIKRASIKQQRIPLGVTARIMIDALSGLHAAHELKDSLGEPLQLVHRDVSPHNVLVGVDGIARISDFGIAKAEARATVTREGSLKGKMSYMAPEQLAGRPVDRRADIYAAGVVLWECLAGRRLFRADSEVETFNLVLQNKILRPSTLWPEVPPELDEIVLRALSLDPEQRFATAAEFAEALEELPIRIAPARTVANTVEDLLTDVLTQRRDIVRSLDIGSEAWEPGALRNAHNAPRTIPGVAHGLPGAAAAAAARAERRARAGASLAGARARPPPPRARDVARAAHRGHDPRRDGRASPHGHRRRHRRAADRGPRTASADGARAAAAAPGAAPRGRGRRCRRPRGRRTTRCGAGRWARRHSPPGAPSGASGDGRDRRDARAHARDAAPGAGRVPPRRHLISAFPARGRSGYPPR